jgi:hypothetical protein
VSHVHHEQTARAACADQESRNRGKAASGEQVACFLANAILRLASEVLKSLTQSAIVDVVTDIHPALGASHATLVGKDIRTMTEKHALRILGLVWTVLVNERESVPVKAIMLTRHASEDVILRDDVLGSLHSDYSM